MHRNLRLNKRCTKKKDDWEKEEFNEMNLWLTKFPTLVAYSALHFHKRLSLRLCLPLVLLCCIHFVTKKCICLYYWQMRRLFSKVVGSMLLSRSFSHQLFQQRFILLSLDIFVLFINAGSITFTTEAGEKNPPHLIQWRLLVVWEKYM